MHRFRKRQASSSPSLHLLDISGERGWHCTPLEGLADKDGLPSLRDQLHRCQHVLQETRSGEAADLINGFPTHHEAGAVAPCLVVEILLGGCYIAHVTCGGELASGIMGREIVEALRYTGYSDSRVLKNVREESSQPIALGYHVTIENSHHVRSASLSHKIKTVIEVCGFGMCLDQFASCAVSEIWVSLFSKTFDDLFAGGRITIVENDNVKFVARVIKIAGGSHFVQ